MNIHLEHQDGYKENGPDAFRVLGDISVELQRRRNPISSIIVVVVPRSFWNTGFYK